MDTGSRPDWAARWAAEMYRRGAKGSLEELVAVALKSWITHGDERPETVAELQSRAVEGEAERGDD